MLESNILSVRYNLWQNENFAHILGSANRIQEKFS